MERRKFVTNLEINEKELKKHIEEYKVVYYNYLKKRLSLLYDGPCIQIYKDLLHPKHKKDIIKTLVGVTLLTLCLKLTSSLSNLTVTNDLLLATIKPHNSEKKRPLQV